MIRQLALLGLLALAGWFGMGQAKAACVESSPGSRSWTQCADKAEAYAKADSYVVTNAIAAQYCDANSGVFQETYWSGTLTATHRFHCGSSGWFGWSQAIAVTSCASSTATWSDTTHTCAEPFDSQACLAHNSEPGFVGVGDTTRVGNSYCSGGCDFRPVAASSPQGSVSVGLPGGGTLARGKWEFTGNACGAPATSPVKTASEITTHNDDPQACTPAGNGQTFCLKKDGEHCASASSGKQICWRPTETGTKTDANVAQTRTSGTNPPTTPPPAPPGDTMTQQPPFTMTTTSTSTSGTSTSNTTTITNYTTASGNDAGGTNCGESTSGTGTSPCQPGTASGGGDCATPPIATDPQLAMVATQAWATRCAVLAGNTVKVTGDVSNCAQPYTVEGIDGGHDSAGSDSNAEKLKALRRQICGAYDDVKATPHDGTGEDVTAADAVEPGSGTGSEVSFDQSGFGFGSTCPAMPVVNVMGTSIDFNANGILCSWITIGGWFVLIITGLWCAKAYSTE